MIKKKIILIGGGGHCKACIDVIESMNEFEIAGVVDVKEKIGQSILGYEIIATDEQLDFLKLKYNYALITLGQIKSSNLRKKLFFKAKELGFVLPVIISKTAHVSKHSIINEGSIIMHHAIVNADVRIGENNIVNSKALIEHDVRIGNHNHISTNATVNGSVLIKDDCFIGSNSIISNNLTIENEVVIGANSFVNKDIVSSGTFIGIPAKKKTI